MQCHANSFAWIESDWTLRDGVNSLISSISCTKQSNLLVHFLRTEKCLYRSFGTIQSFGLLGYTLRHLHQRVAEHTKQSSSIGKHFINEHCIVPKSKGLKLPNNVEVKLSQFADDTTLICKDIEWLKENIMIINKFAKISGLKLNKKKTKAIWIGSQKKNKTKPLAIDITNEPTKTLGIYISYNRNKNNNQNFFIKIQKMETKLNVWLSWDLTLMGRTLLVKALGISKIVYFFLSAWAGGIL